MYVLQNLHWFVLFIGVLVFVHELGHFVVAKAVGVKVLRFSIGFGPRLFGITRGETEYWVSALPLGGYVKMLGEVPGLDIPAEDAARALNNKPVWQRSCIALAGPVANFILAFVVYFLMNLGVHTFHDTRIGIVSFGDPAWQAGLRPGDEIVAIDGVEVTDWGDLRQRISTRPGAHLQVAFTRDGVRREVEVVPRRHDEANQFAEIETRGRVGISSNYVKPIVGIVDPDAPAAVAGVQTDDVIESVNGTPVSAWHELAVAVRATVAGEPVRLELRRGDGDVQRIDFMPTVVPAGLDSNLFSAADTEGGYTGLVSKDCLVAKVEAGTPASRIGLKPGDRLLHLAIEKKGKRIERPIGVWGIDLAAFQGVDATSQFELTYQRGSETFTHSLKLLEREETDEFKNKRTHHVFGATNDFETLDSYTFERSIGPIEAFTLAGGQVALATTLIGKGLAKLVQGDIPLDNLGGPIMLFVIAEKSAKRGLEEFMGMMALISVNLGLLNLLPIPVLDGGHLMLHAIEAIRRRPPSLRARELAQLVGMALLLLLMVLVFKNDILRFVLG